MRGIDVRGGGGSRGEKRNLKFQNKNKFKSNTCYS